MIPFAYARAADTADAVRLGSVANAKYLGGGTNLVDLMRETIERRLGTDPQHGHGGREHAAAHPLPLLLRP